MSAAEPFFAASYSEARRLFLAAAGRAGARIESHRHPLRGPGGEKLYCDTAVLGDPSARNWLVVMSAVHGVEGFCGSGVQVGWLERGGAGDLAPGTSVLLIHALNPWGFAHETRTTEDGSDLCRNFVDFDAPPPAVPAHAGIVADLVPEDWFGPGKEEADARLAAFARRNGDRALVGTIARGQYTHAFAPFYGGFRPAWSNLLFRRLIERHLGRAEKVVCVDYHTGLGPPGIGQLLLFHPPGGRSEAWARAIWGERAAQTATGESIAYELTGSILGFLEAGLPDATVAAGAYEFGTLPPEEVFLHALRADRWLDEHGSPGTAQWRELKARVRGAFYVETPEWKDKVLEQAVWAHGAGLAALSG